MEQIEMKNLEKQLEELLENENSLFTKFATVLFMEDEENFEIMRSIFLEEVSRALAPIENKTKLYIAFKTNGGTIEQIDEMVNNFYNVMNEKDLELSVIRREFLIQFFSIVVNAFKEAEGLAEQLIRIPIELTDTAKMPTYAHTGDSGMDLYSTEDITILPGATVLVPTGIKMAIPPGYEIQVRPKSGISSKSKLRVANTPGTVDSSYRGEIKVIIENIEAPIQDIEYEFEAGGDIKIKSILHGKEAYVHAGEKIAQLVLMKVPKAVLFEVGEISEDTTRGEGGFGSTGVL